MGAYIVLDDELVPAAFLCFVRSRTRLPLRRIPTGLCSTRRVRERHWGCSARQKI